MASDLSALGYWESIWYPNHPEGWVRRAALSPLSLPALLFRAGVGCRNAAYSRGWLSAIRVEEASVISIGNLNVGGTGKTPAVIYLANLLGAGGRRVAILSRGYGRKSRGAVRLTAAEETAAETSGDEPLLIARRCPKAVVWVGNDRVDLARRARREDGIDLFLLDDGMQYRRLHRDLEIAVVDEAVGLGNGRLLPRGPLREPAAALARADLLWIRTSGERSFQTAGRASIRARYAPSAALSPAGDEQPPAAIRDRLVYAFAGVARPTSFLRTLGELSAKVVGSRFVPDHHRFTPEELQRLLDEAKGLQAEMLVTTEKDRVRLPIGFPAWAIRIDVEIVEGADILSQRLAIL
ncbi:MAG TPA: tetraacyldisaccharide 4'-kinase [Myxococcaceae bacterium]|nr:tetraacyldisaccharide 4'-kinase [Myxococcaceae bacterium]